MIEFSCISKEQSFHCEEIFTEWKQGWVQWAKRGKVFSFFLSFLLTILNISAQIKYRFSVPLLLFISIFIYIHHSLFFLISIYMYVHHSFLLSISIYIYVHHPLLLLARPVFFFHFRPTLISSQPTYYSQQRLHSFSYFNHA